MNEQDLLRIPIASGVGRLPTIAEALQLAKRCAPGADVTYEDVFRGAMSMIDVRPVDPDTEGRARSWTFTPRQPNADESDT